MQPVEPSKPPPIPQPQSSNRTPSTLAKDLSQDLNQTTTDNHPSNSPPHPPNFNPFFTLLSSPSTDTHHHPTVHYIFSTDDPDHLTDALLSTISPSRSPSPTSTSSSPPPRTQKEITVIVDVDDSGTQVVKAQSLSHEWQVTNAEIGPAPTWEGEGRDGGLMLRVDGVECARVSERRERGMEELMEEWERRMEELRGVVRAGKVVSDGRAGDV